MTYYNSVFMLNKAVNNLEISKYIFLKAYAGDAIAIYKSKSWWMLEHSEIYPLKNPVETWKLFSRENFVYGLNCLRLFNVPFEDDFDSILRESCESCESACNFEVLMWYHCFYRHFFEKSEIVSVVSDVTILKWLYYSVYSNVVDGMCYFEKAFYAAVGVCDDIKILNFFLSVIPQAKQDAFLKACVLGHSNHCFWFLKKGCILNSEAINNVLMSGNLELLKDIMVIRPRGVIVNVPSKRTVFYYVFLNIKGEKKKSEFFDKIMICVDYLRNLGF